VDMVAVTVLTKHVYVIQVSSPLVFDKRLLAFDKRPGSWY
jgi:hypothetical protein